MSKLRSFGKDAEAKQLEKIRFLLQINLEDNIQNLLKVHTLQFPSDYAYQISLLPLPPTWLLFSTSFFSNK